MLNVVSKLVSVEEADSMEWPVIIISLLLLIMSNNNEALQLPLTTPPPKEETIPFKILPMNPSLAERFEDTDQNNEDYKADDPCNYDRVNHTRPESSRKGKRVSDIKCDEYSWDYWTRIIESDRRAEECKQQLKDPSTVFGGMDAKYGDFPHMGALFGISKSNKTVFECGCSLISYKFALTAAHCVTIMQYRPYRIRFGNTSGSEGKGVSLDVGIKNIFIHPNYSQPYKYYDIALMELEYELKTQAHIRPACIWSGAVGNKWVGNITGWGKTTPESNSASNNLNYAEIEIWEKGSCNKSLKGRQNRLWKDGLKDHQFCAGKLGVDTCQGDSGGPIGIRRPSNYGESGFMHHVVGITNFGIKCGTKLPGVYTNATTFLCFIEKTVWPEEPNEFCP